MDKIEDDICNRYLNGESAVNIQSNCFLSLKKIYNILRCNNVKIRKRKDYVKFDKTYFDQIDNEKKAYILGLLFADGYNQESNGSIRLVLNSQDKQILEQIAKEVKFTGELKQVNNGKYLGLYLSSGYTSSRLAKLGCSQAKSLTLKFPQQIPQALVRHFIRGYFDGDGCIYYKGTKAQVSIISTIDFCKSIDAFFTPLIGSKKLANLKINNKTKIYWVSGRNQIQIIYNTLYQDSSIFLKRKYDKFKSYLCI